MKKLGFTLAELIITLAIIGAAAALVVPTLSDLVPDKNKVKVLRYNTMMGSAIDDILSDENLYHPYTIYNEATEEYTKSCEGLACVGNAFTGELRRRIGIDADGRTSDGSLWTFLGGTDNVYQVHIDLDVNKRNFVYPSTPVQDPKRASSFWFKIDENGTVLPADPLTEAYLLNPFNPSDRKKDFAKAKSMKTKKY